MKKILILLAIILVTSVSYTNAQTHFSKKTQKEILIDADGKEIAFKDVLEKYKDKTIVMEIWASWCGDCVGAMPKVKELQANNPNVVYLFISMDKTFDKWKAGIEKHQLQGEQYWVNDAKGMKGSFGKSLNLDWIPRYIIIDKTGEIVLYHAVETEFEKINSKLKTLE